MFDTAFIDTSNFDKVYNISMNEMKAYYKDHDQIMLSDNIVSNMIPHAKFSATILSGLKDIVHDLNYDKERFEELVFTLDDDYDMLNEFIKPLNKNIQSHKELLDISNTILDNLMVVQRELGFIISDHENS